MPAETFASVLPNLSIGVVCVLAVVVIAWLFVRHLERCNKAATQERSEGAIERAALLAAANVERQGFLTKIEEHHEAMSGMEKDIRENVMSQLSAATDQIRESTHVMTRIIDYIDQPDLRSTRRRTTRT